MKLSELPQTAEEDFEEDAEGEDVDTELAEDLCEARELLEAFISIVEPLLRQPRKKLTLVQEQELIELCQETTGFIEQWEDI